MMSTVTLSRLTAGIAPRSVASRRFSRKVLRPLPSRTFSERWKRPQRLTKNIGYIGAGTVEYLYNAETDKYFFLELNPRLQVEHLVTEGITGVNLRRRSCKLPWVSHFTAF